MDAEFAPSMIYITNLDKPGFIGRFSSTLGDAGDQHRDLPRRPRGALVEDAVALIEIDGELPPDVLAKVRALPQVQQAKPLKFPTAPHAEGSPRHASVTSTGMDEGARSG